MPANEEGVLWIPNKNAWSGRNGLTPRYVILHGTAGGSSAEATAAYFQTTEGSDNPVSSHYIIGRDGTVVQCIDESDSAWGNGVLTLGHDSFWPTTINSNLLTVSIEHVKPSTDNSDNLTEPQRASSFALVKHICQRWSIPMRPADGNGGITGHFSLDPVNRSRCPGTFPFPDLWNYLKGGDDMLQLTDPFALAFFQDAGGKGWFCPHTKMYIGGAILDYYRQVQGAPRLPLTNEIKDVAGHPEVAYQLFEAGMVVFDPNHAVDAPAGMGRCFMVKLADALPQRYLVTPAVQGVRDQLNNALSQIKSLQSQLAQTQNNTPVITDMKNRLGQIHTISDVSGDFLK
jgi:hypothetical protein